ncbi:MAG: dUTP diphosphatase [Oligoflexales bacterium]
MISFRCEPGQAPAYQTTASAGADIRAAEAATIPPHGHACIRTGVWIDQVEWGIVPKGYTPELQIRPRSGLAYKHGITLTNSVGTVDADYKDEIKVLLWNTSDLPYEIQVGDRIAQMVPSLVPRLETLLSSENVREGGFGSTGRH